MKFTVIKTYPHSLGLSCAFRQPLAPSTHCSRLHGYSLAVELAFSCNTLDDRDWVLSFGDLKQVKEELIRMLDHKTLVSSEDEHLDLFIQMHDKGVLNLVICDNGVGCEKFSEHIARNVVHFLDGIRDYRDRGVRLEYVKISEHEGNSVRCDVPPPGDKEYLELFYSSKTPGYRVLQPKAYAERTVE